MSNKAEINRLLATENHYQVLGIPKNATKDQIKKAYREMALKYHPDKNSVAEAKQVFNKISLAYQLLSDDTQRKIYDQPKLINKNSNVNPQKKQQTQKNNKFNNKSQKASAPQFKSHYYDYKQKQYEQEFQRQQSQQSKQKKKQQNKFKDFPRRQNPQYNSQYNKSKYRNSINQRARRNNLQAFIVLVIFFIVWYFWSSSEQNKPIFAFKSNQIYNVKRKTQLLKVPYFIKQDQKDKRHMISQSHIEQKYIQKLENECIRVLNTRRLYKQWADRSNSLLQQNTLIDKANNIEVKSCKKIVKLLKKHPEIKLNFFANKIIDI